MMMYHTHRSPWRHTQRHRVVFLVLLLPMLGTAGFFLGLESVGEITPKGNPYLFAGETLTLNCTLKTDDKNLSTLYFKRGSQIIPEEYVTILNNRTAQLNYPLPANFIDKNDLNYACWLESRSSPVASKTVETEYAPQNVTNFKCRVYNWDEWMECTWDLGVPYHRLCDGSGKTCNVEVVFLWRHVGLPEWHTCSNQTVTSCFWKKSSTISFDNVRLAFQVTVKNTKVHISAISPNYRVNTGEIVEPRPVTQSDFMTVVNSSCIDANWTHPSMDARSKLYKLSWTSPDNETTSENTIDISHQICGLKPYTLYRLSIVVKPFVMGDLIGYWSTAVTNDVTTAEDIPDGPPEIVPGSFSPQLCDTGKRNVTIYWKLPAESVRNGALTGFNMLYTPSSPGGPDTAYLEVVGGSAISGTLELLCASAYDVELRAMTKVGQSKSASYLHIVADNTELIPPAEIIVEFEENGLAAEISWEEPPVDSRSPDVTGYTVFWCYTGGSYLCKDDSLKWHQVAANQTAVALSFPSKDGLLIGVSMETSMCSGIAIESVKCSTGLNWEDCSYVKAAKPYPPKSPSLGNNAPNKGLVLTWDPLSCDNNIPSTIIQNYVVHWCKAPGNYCSTYDVWEVTLAADIREYTVKGLGAGSRYGLSVSAISKAGEFSKRSETIFGIPIDKK